MTQIECDSLSKAANGCLQYYQVPKLPFLGNIDCATCDQQGVSGTMFSFNYNGGSGLQLSNTDYSMYVFLMRTVVLRFLSSRCVRMERNFCGIEYTACDDTINPSPQSFSVSGSSNTGSQVKRHLWLQLRNESHFVSMGGLEKRCSQRQLVSRWELAAPRTG